MKLKTTSEYALRILAHMSTFETQQHTTMDLSTHLNIPYKYLTRVMTHLSKAGFIKSTRGKYGGVSLAKSSESITLYEILSAMNDLNDDVCIMGEGLCSEGEECVLHGCWSKPKQLIDEMFKQSTLKDLIKKPAH